MNMNQFKKAQTQAAKGGGGILAVALGLGVLGYSSFFNVDSGHRAVKFNKITGTGKRVYREGTHLKVPFLEKVIDYDIRAKARVFSSPTASSDLQMVNISLRVLTRPDEGRIVTIYKHLGADYDDRVLPSIVNDTLKGVVAKFEAQDLITSRSQVADMVMEGLRERARQFHMLIDDASIINLSFGEVFAKSVEAKQVATQEAKRAELLVQRAAQEKQRTIVAAKGTAEAAKMISETIKDNPDFLTLRKLEAAREIAQELANSPNTIYLDSSSLLVDVLGTNYSRFFEKII